MIKINQRGFTLIELAAVLAVIAVTSAILLVNNSVNQQQLALSTDAASLANAVSRAKALTLQNLDDSICGYGVHFIPGVIGGAEAAYEIFKDAKINNSCDPAGRVYAPSDSLVGSGVPLGSDLNFISSTAASSYFIQDVVFYSSDAKVKLAGFNNDQDIQPAGVVIIATNSMPTSFITLKITTSGQVTRKNGAYVNAGDFDSGTQSDFTYADGQFTVTGQSQNQGSQQSGQQVSALNPGSEGGCLADCSCASHLASGKTCPDGCGGVCYPGSGGGGGSVACSPNPVDICDNKTCADQDNCGASCVICPSGQICNTTSKQCVVCTPDCSGKSCGQDDGCGNPCASASVCLRIDSIDPPIGFK